MDKEKPKEAKRFLVLKNGLFLASKHPNVFSSYREKSKDSNW